MMTFDDDMNLEFIIYREEVKWWKLKMEVGLC